jgi:hypothetical protein
VTAVSAVILNLLEEITMTKSPSKQTTKASQIIKLLSRTNGASLDELMKVSDWQQHSLRGFLSGTVKKKLGHQLSSQQGKNGIRRYRIESPHGEAAE